MPRTRCRGAATDRGARAEYGLRVGNVFHAGDGNLHPLVLYDRRNEGEPEKASELAEAILEACMDAGGSLRRARHRRGQGVLDAAHVLGARPRRHRAATARVRPRRASAIRERSYRPRACAARCRALSTPLSSWPALPASLDASRRRDDPASLAADAVTPRQDQGESVPAVVDVGATSSLDGVDATAGSSSTTSGRISSCTGRSNRPPPRGVRLSRHLERRLIGHEGGDGRPRLSLEPPGDLGPTARPNAMLGTQMLLTGDPPSPVGGCRGGTASGRCATSSSA